MFEQDDIDQLNEDIELWEVHNHGDLLKEMDSLGIKHNKNSPNKTPLRRAVKSKLRKHFGLIDRISYSMPRSAIFLHKGVSRGHNKTNPRTPKPWFNPVIDKNIGSLADVVAEGQGNLIVNSIKIR